MKGDFLYIIKLLLILIVLMCVLYVLLKYKAAQPREMSERDIINKNNSEFIANVQNLSEEVETISLNELTDFEWDEVREFPPYVDPVDIVGKHEGVSFSMGVEGLEHTNILFMKDNKPVCYIFGSVYELKFYITLCDPNTDGDRSVYKNSEHILFSVGHDWDWIELRLLQYQ